MVDFNTFINNFSNNIHTWNDVYNALSQFQDVVWHTISKNLRNEVSKNVNLT